MFGPNVIDKSRLLHKIPFPFSQEKMSGIFIENISTTQNDENRDLLIKVQFLIKVHFYGPKHPLFQSFQHEALYKLPFST